MGKRKKGEDMENQNVELQRSQSSVQFKRDAKGTLSYEVKVYADTPEEALAKAMAASKQADAFIGAGG